MLKLTVTATIAFLPAAASAPYKLPLAGWIVVFLFFCSMALIPWVAAVLGRATSMLSGTITGAFISLITGLFAGPAYALLVVVFTVPTGFTLDILVTREYQRARREKTKPSWWAGGTWMDTP